MTYAITAFLSAFLLFSVQLIVAKALLPRFGGVPAVWTTCMLFFQVALLLGYGYACLLDLRVAPRHQARVHTPLLAASFGLLILEAVLWRAPLIPEAGAEWAGTDHPAARVVAMLSIAIGLPFLLLSATSPLLQRWLAIGRPQARDPYRLYALSNAGSLLGLLSYPFLIEPLLPLRWQAFTWAGLYGVFAAACRHCGRPLRIAAAPPAGGRLAGCAVEASRTPEGRMPGAVIAAWILLPACASALLLATTNKLCQEIAVVPFLWVLPLAGYLVSFIICFDNPRWYVRAPSIAAGACLTLTALTTEMLGVRARIPAHATVYTLFLVSLCVICHGELFRLRPGPARLTQFYLALACGGAAGGLFVALLAPLFFRAYWEFHVTVLLSWVLLAWLLYRDKSSFFFCGHASAPAALLLAASYIAVRPVLGALGLTGRATQHASLLHLLVALLVAGLAWMPLRRLRLVRAPIWPRIMVGATLFFAECFLIQEIRSTAISTVDSRRNFFGVLRVQVGRAAADGTPYLQLTHGQINHGIQFLTEGLRSRPAGYCTGESGVGLALALHARRANGVSGPQPIRIGVTGLGVGALAAHARPGDSIRFYEINPAVVEYAAGPRAYFSYIRDCAGAAELVLGDARLALERELREGRAQAFDLLILDAFSSDSVPVHLLTREAFRVYAAHLRDADSVIAVNVSNRFLDLQPVVSTMADELGMEARLVPHLGAPPEPIPSLWVLMTRDGRLFDRPEFEARAQPCAHDRRIVWTDQYSNILALLL